MWGRKGEKEVPGVEKKTTASNLPPLKFDRGDRLVSLTPSSRRNRQPFPLECERRDETNLFLVQPPHLRPDPFRRLCYCPNFPRGVFCLALDGADDLP